MWLTSRELWMLWERDCGCRFCASAQFAAPWFWLFSAKSQRRHHAREAWAGYR